jgi:uncharacterized protein YggE
MEAPLHRRTEEIGACLADPFANGEGGREADTFTIPEGRRRRVYRPGANLTLAGRTVNRARVALYSLGRWFARIAGYAIVPETMELPMAELPLAALPAVAGASFRRSFVVLAAAAAIFAPPGARAQQRAQQPQPMADQRIVVSGDGSVSVPPDRAQVRSGVTTRAVTVKEAVAANSKLMSAVLAALGDAGIPPKDIQTSQFSIRPVYAQEPRNEPKLTGYSVSNQVTVILREIGKVGDTLDRIIAAGATDAGNIAFLVNDPSKALDQAREAAVADAKRKAEVYAKAAGVQLGRVAWITEGSASGPLPPVPMMARAAGGAAPVPIAAGEDTLRAHVTVGFDIAR